MALSHIRDDVSSKQEDRLYRCPPMVGLAPITMDAQNNASQKFACI